MNEFENNNNAEGNELNNGSLDNGQGNVYSDNNYNNNYKSDNQTANYSYSSRSGQYDKGGSYERTYRNINKDNNKKPNKKGKKTAALAILIIVCMIMSSVATSLVVTYIYNHDNNYVSGHNNDNPDVRVPGGVDGPVIIHKNEGTKVEIVEGEVGQPNMSVAQISKLVADSVVEITTSSVKYDIFYGQQIISGAGSGVIIGQSKDNKDTYYIVTNEHVIDDAEKVSARLRNGTELDCRIIGSDVIADIAVLEIKSDKELNVAHLGNSDNLLVGEEVVVIGNPLGELGGTVTNGIISALERDVSVQGLEMKLLQTNAAISPGNSGGGMFNTSGELVGVVNAKSTDASAEGLGFAIPINSAYSVIDDILSFGYVTGRATLPVTVKQYRSSSMLGSTTMCLVVTSESGDFKFNDVLYSVDGVRVSTYNQLVSVMSKHSVGDEINVQVARTIGQNVKTLEFKIKLVEAIPSAD